MRIVYLHGFASGPRSNKAQFFRAKFAERGVDCEIPQLDQGDFESLTVSGQLQVVDEAVASLTPGDPVILMGSSLGGYLAAAYAARHPNVGKLVLLAPAFQFPSRWRKRFEGAEMDEWKRTGGKNFYHYAFGEERRLGYRFVEDAAQYEDEPDFPQPALILHGTRDDVVPPEVSESFVGRHPNASLRLVDSGHALTDVLDTLWAETSQFLGFQNA
ncbi:MAG TPA: YqiA/YcfP family alpha/beta fold hydrolase [Bryobacteraceae bacterium]|nr:YqiA/YcfP family alpha/beta fold hydrolase [Bryobacteraceae bacterium]